MRWRLRAVLHLLKRRETALTPLVRALQAVEANMASCHICGNVDTRDPCGICTDPRRDAAQLCVVEEIAVALRRRLTPFRRAQFQAVGRLARSHAEHGSVVRAVLARDAAAANAAMLIHMSIVEDAFETVDAAPAQTRETARDEVLDRRHPSSSPRLERSRR